MKLSIVTTMYYSRNYLPEFYKRTLSVTQLLNLPYEFIFVDDGSPDDSLQIALQLQNDDPNIKIIELSKNFGHQKAIMTGLQFAEGDFVYLIDCDLEEEPELLKEFWSKIQNARDVDVVYGVQTKRKGSWFERFSGRLFYKMLSSLSSVKYPTDTMTARIMSRNYVDSLLQFREKELDLWSIFAIAGFRQIPVAATKGYKGVSTFTFKKKIKRAVEVITSFSHRPLYLTFILGILSFVIALINVGIIVYDKIILEVNVEGWASILASVWLVGGMILLVLGIFGIYLSKMFLEIKSRPLTIVRNVYTK
ncbi:MAG: glycosyltransferase family 2 protein [Bacteroidetes bacterium]|nr:glycosyltransferase family 2 protein [Bacteroidota bacterium]